MLLFYEHKFSVSNIIWFCTNPPDFETLAGCTIPDCCNIKHEINIDMKKIFIVK